MSESILDEILTILQWAWNSPVKREKLAGALELWLAKNDDGKAQIRDLAEKFANEVNIDDLLAINKYRGPIVNVRGIWDAGDGLYYVTFWYEPMGNGLFDHHNHQMVFTPEHGIEKIKRQIRRVAAIQAAIAERALETILVQWIDLDDLPRAWASGPRYLEEDVRDLAKENFDAYLDEKLQKDQPLPCEPEDFRERILIVGVDWAESEDDNE